MNSFKFVSPLSVVFIFLAIHCTAQLRITFNFAAAQKIAEALEHPTDRTAIESILREPAVKSMMYHCSAFDKRMTDSSFVETLYLVSHDKPLSADPFRFRLAKERVRECRSLIDYCNSNKANLETEISRQLAGYANKAIDFKIEVLVTLGSNSTGWTDDILPNNFGMDLLNLRGDEVGLKLVSIHELFHMIQGRTFSQRALSANPTVDQLLRETILEGSAVMVADYSKVNSGGSYVASEKKSYTANLGKLETSFALFDALLFQAKDDANHSQEQLYNIGLSGMYDSPFYFVGYHICQKVEEAMGRKKLVDMFESDLLGVYLAYIDLYSSRTALGLPKFSKTTEQTLRALAARK